MPVSEKEAVAFMERVVALFKSWPNDPPNSLISEIKAGVDPTTGWKIWDIKVRPKLQYAVTSVSIERDNLILTGAPFLIEYLGIDGKDGWIPVPPLTPESYTAAVRLPGGLGGLWDTVTATLGGAKGLLPGQIEVQIPTGSS